MSSLVLLVEDDKDLGPLLKQYLELNDFDVHLRTNGKEARQALKELSYNIVLTDVMMPVEDGFTFAENIVQHYPDTPFLFITARKLKQDVIKGLKIGADDYIIKPFDADELILRIRNILRRNSPKSVEARSLAIGMYTFFSNELRLIGPNGSKTLTERESQLLHLLRKNVGQLVKKQDILEQLWEGSDFFAGRSLDVFISRLRKYLSDDPAIKIESVRSVGVRMNISE
jgi:DNA-binding response OmpR family regulator